MEGKNQINTKRRNITCKKQLLAYTTYSDTYCEENLAPIFSSLFPICHNAFHNHFKESLLVLA